MAMTVNETASGVVEMTVSGKVTHAEYLAAMPLMEKALAAGDHLRVLVTMENFHGLELKAAWDDLVFAFKHIGLSYGDHEPGQPFIERLAMEGDSAWEAWLAKMAKPFTRTELRYFDSAEPQAARAWLREGIVAARP